MKFSYKDSSFLSEEIIQKTAASVLSYVKTLQNTKPGVYEIPESSIQLPLDEEILKSVELLVKKLVTAKLKYIIDIGIGGSNLGTKAVYDALSGFFDIVEPGRFPKIFFVDTDNPAFLSRLSSFLKKNVRDKEEILINIISKSGTTTETVSNFEFVVSSIESTVTGWEERVVCTTDVGSKLWNLAAEKGYERLALPAIVGGRYSIFTSVGLFPLLAAGIDIQTLREGARKAVSYGTSEDLHTNLPLLSASILYLQYQNKKTINDNFFFNGELESLGKWYRQLMGESIGKEGKGLTPTVSIGSTDLHSVAQLYYGGPHDKITTIIWSEKNDSDMALPQKLNLDNLVSNIENKKASDIMRAIIGGVKISYTNEKMPYMEIVLDDISSISLGEYMQFKMIEMMYLGKLLGINTFDQPHVELYKKEMKKILSGG